MDPTDISAAVDAYLNDGNRPGQAARIGVFGALDSNPDLEGELRKASRATGVPLETARAFPDDVKKRAAVEAIDFTRVARDFPKTAALLADQDTARLVRDDVHNLSAMERAIRGLKSGWKTADRQVDTTDLNMQELEGRALTPEQLKQRADIEQELQGLAKDQQGEGVLGMLARTAAYSARQGGTSIYSAAAGAGYGGAAGAALGATVGGVGAAPGAAAGMFVGGAMGSAIQAYRMEASSAWRDLSQMKDLNGQVMDPSAARAAAQAIGVANAAIEVGSDLALVMLPGMAKLVEGAVGKEGMKLALLNKVKAGLADPVRRSAVMQALKTATGVGALEGAEEFFQNLIQALGREAGQAASGQTFPADSIQKDIAEAGNAALEAFTGTTLTFGVLGGGNTWLQTRKEAQRAQKADAAASMLEQLQALSAASKTLQRDAVTAREFVAQAADEHGDNPTEFYVSGEQLLQTLNQSGMSRAELEAVAPVAASQLDEAQAGADIRLPVSEFIGLGDKATALIDHIRVGENEPTRAEARQFMDTQGEELRKQVEAEMQRRSDGDAFKQSVNTLQTQFQGELDAAGRFRPEVNKAYATLLANYFGATAARLGMTPQELAQRYRLRVASKTATGERVMEQPGQQQSAPQSAIDLDTKGGGSRSFQMGDTTVDYGVSSDGKRLEVVMVRTPKNKRGTGSARAALKALLDEADSRGMQVVLTAEPMDRATSKAKLEKFYRSLGFVPNKGRAKDFTTMAGMVREPRAVLNQTASPKPSPDTIELRKRVKVLESLLECMT